MEIIIERVGMIDDFTPDGMEPWLSNIVGVLRTQIGEQLFGFIHSINFNYRLGDSIFDYLNWVIVLGKEDVNKTFSRTWTQTEFNISELNSALANATVNTIAQSVIVEARSFLSGLQQLTNDLGRALDAYTRLTGERVSSSK